MWSLSKRISFTYYFDLPWNLMNAEMPVISVWDQKSSLRPLLDLRRIQKRWCCLLSMHPFPLRLLMYLPLEFYSFLAIRYFYLPRFDLMMGTFLDVIFGNKTHADTSILRGMVICLLSYWRNLTAHGKINTTLGPYDFFRTSVAFEFPTLDLRPLAENSKATSVLNKSYAGPVWYLIKQPPTSAAARGPQCPGDGGDFKLPPTDWNNAWGAVVGCYVSADIKMYVDYGTSWPVTNRREEIRCQIRFKLLIKIKIVINMLDAQAIDQVVSFI